MNIRAQLRQIRKMMENALCSTRRGKPFKLVNVVVRDREQLAELEATGFFSRETCPPLPPDFPLPPMNDLYEHVSITGEELLEHLRKT